MTCSELLKILNKETPSQFLCHGKKHDKWINPETGVKFVVPRHPSDEIAIGTAHEILKLAGYKA